MTFFIVGSPDFYLRKAAMGGGYRPFSYTQTRRFPSIEEARKNRENWRQLGQSMGLHGTSAIYRVNDNGDYMFISRVEEVVC